jgi:hypothetical protein
MGLGSGIRDPGVKKAPDPGSRIRIRNTESNTTVEIKVFSYFYEDKRRDSTQIHFLVFKPVTTYST